MDEKQAPEDSMGRPKSAPKTKNVRITEKAHEAASSASGFTGESLTEYLSRIVEEKATKDTDEGYAKMLKSREESLAEAKRLVEERKKSKG